MSLGEKKDSMEVLEFHIGRGQGSDWNGGLGELVFNSVCRRLRML